MYRIDPCSPEMQDAINKHKPADDERWDQRYPFADLSIGQSFTLPMDKKKLQSLRVLCSTAGTLLRMRFKVLVHEKYGLIEVGRLQ